MKFTEIIVKNIENQEEKNDFSKLIGNELYKNGKDVDVCETGKKIYYGEEVELSEDAKALVKQVIAGFPYIYRTAIESMLE